MADNSAKIAELETRKEAGADKVTVDGVTVEFDGDSTDRQLRSLRERDDTAAGRRPYTSTIKLT